MRKNSIWDTKDLFSVMSSQDDGSFSDQFDMVARLGEGAFFTVFK